MIFSLFKRTTNLSDLEGSYARRMVMRTFLHIMMVLYALGIFMEFTIGFKNSPSWVFPALFLSAVVFRTALSWGMNLDVLVLINLLFILCFNQLVIYLNPSGYPVMVYWIGVMPLFLIVITSLRNTVVWSIITVVFITANGLYVEQKMGFYMLEVYPMRFMVAGILFTLVTFSVAGFLITYK